MQAKLALETDPPMNSENVSSAHHAFPTNGQAALPHGASAGRDQPVLLPAPRTLLLLPGDYRLENELLILLECPSPLRLRFSAARFQNALRERLSFSWEVVASRATPGHLVGLRMRLAPEVIERPQGYRLLVTPRGITIEGHDTAGVFYAVCTLVQLIEQHGSRLPCLQIADWPDFPVRGVMLDISRDKVPTMETLYALVDMLAGWKVNQLQLYTEHTFAYRRHPQVWESASPMTGQDILDLDVYCSERYIELVPNQNSFGHMHRWLAHPRYASLAEAPEGFQAPWGRIEDPFSLNPTDPESLALVTGLYDELLPHFASRIVNVGCDETFDLGQGLSKAECERRGVGQVYLEFLMHIYQDLKSRGYTMQFWGDIVIQHPDLIPFLPRDLIALVWGYEANHPFADYAARFASAGIQFYVCPGTSSWCSLAGRSDNAIANLRSAAENGLKYGAVGFLNTDWGDNGHWQFLPVSYLGFAAGAAYSWALEANRDMDVTHVLDLYAFKDRAGVMGCLAFQLGNLYQAMEIDWVHSSPLFWILQRSLENAASHPKIRKIPFRQVLEALERISVPLPAANLDRPDAALILREYQFTIRLMRHACRRGILAVMDAETSIEKARLAEELHQEMDEMTGEYEELWLERNREGGMPDSVARLVKAGEDYRTVLKGIE